MRKYLGAVAARPYAGFRRFGRVISRGSPNLVLTWVVTALNNPPRYVIDINGLVKTVREDRVMGRGVAELYNIT